MNAHNQQQTLIRSLLDANVYDHPVTDIELIETHISWVILTGGFAYKIKKSVNLGFLDFSTLEKRQHCCNEELRLNSRLAAEIYLEVVSITGRLEQPVLRGPGEAFEYAVKMVQFPQQAQLDNMLANHELHQHHIDAIARLVAGFHEAIAVATDDSDYGDPDHVFQPVAENFRQIRRHRHSTTDDAALGELEQWSQATFESLKPLLEQRKRDGFIRECHGDMHLRNLVWFHDKPLAFDCLEFNPALRWIDTLSEVAFLVMDLDDRDQPRLAQRFLNSYLEYCGDYSGVQVLRFYLVYRALVRAKVDAIRGGQAHISASDQRQADEDYCAYLRLGQSYIRPARPKLIITRGLSASGKSTLTQPLLESIGAIRIRSDVERKRLFGVRPGGHSKAGIDQGIYSVEAGVQTYDQLKRLAADVLAAGFTVIVDAAFLKYQQRVPFKQLAVETDSTFVILEFTASADTLRQRIRARVGDVSDADLAVLEHQLTTTQPLSDGELPYRIEIDTETDFDLDALIEALTQLDVATR
jgi:aminoglycoside phosphotransferase family enzyme/predicted kinase